MPPEFPRQKPRPLCPETWHASAGQGDSSAFLPHGYKWLGSTMGSLLSHGKRAMGSCHSFIISHPTTKLCGGCKPYAAALCSLSESVMLFRFPVWDLGQGCLELLSTGALGALGEVVLGFHGRDLLCHGGCHKLVDRHMVSF